MCMRFGCNPQINFCHFFAVIWFDPLMVFLKDSFVVNLKKYNRSQKASKITQNAKKSIEPDCLVAFFFSKLSITIVVPTKSDSDFMIGLQSYQGLIIDRSLVY